MKIGVSSYSFNALYQSGEMNHIDVIRKAKEMGFDLIEFLELIPSKAETKLSLACKIREECERVGIEVINYAVEADFLFGSKGDWQKEVERLISEVAIAEVIGAKYMRHDVTRGFSINNNQKSFENILPILIKGCRAVADNANDKGIRTLVENHGYFFQDSERIEKLMAGVQHENFGLLLDIGNFLCVDEDPVKAVGKLIQYAYHVHIKDFHVKSGMSYNPGTGWFQTRSGNYLRGAIIGHGDVPVAQCLKIISKSQYNGAVSIEFEGIEDSILGVDIGHENIKRYISEIV